MYRRQKAASRSFSWGAFRRREYDENERAAQKLRCFAAARSVRRSRGARRVGGIARRPGWFLRFAGGYRAARNRLVRRPLMDLAFRPTTLEIRIFARRVPEKMQAWEETLVVPEQAYSQKKEEPYRD